MAFEDTRNNHSCGFLHLSANQDFVGCLKVVLTTQKINQDTVECNIGQRYPGNQANRKPLATITISVKLHVRIIPVSLNLTPPQKHAPNGASLHF